MFTILGPDSPHRVKYINGNAFQQEGILTFNGWQYAVFYSPSSSVANENGLVVHVARRELPGNPWETIALEDYVQTADDPHNTIQMGISPGDGKIHLSFDHHCDQLRYRISIPGLAAEPAKFQWTAEHFSPVMDHLPGLPDDHQLFREVTYPRFVLLDQDMLFSFRTGRAGLGSDHLWRYSSKTGEYTYLGQNLTGIKNNPFVNGLEFRNGRLHVTWTYRGWIYYEGWDDPLDTKHKQHSGPNEIENNHDICYVYSDDEGYSWKNGAGELIADLRNEKNNSVMPDSPGIVAFKIPKNTGLSNQEAQAVDQDGGVHVLNRDCAQGPQLWKHYYRDLSGAWTQRALPDVDGRLAGLRGRVAVSKNGDLFFVLPGNDEAGTLKILKATKAKYYADYTLVVQKSGFTWEPLVDSRRLNFDGVLSVFATHVEDGERNVVVVDFEV